ncbi:aldo/keto reductase [Steroidobacter sp.]|uniref:aldo/keto reductase n=1 Tax=Steroidobacter sp. TaxID=1978227 RepID=UPI001A552281|nr:aldo/keto reductase [Steroidobacter sp.]MBL8268778.1 aldo/keto reductase [Steroidobacter sp.]
MPARVKDRISLLGFGGAAIGNLYRAIPESMAFASVAAALAEGVLYMDTAPHYGFGLSEQRLGAALAELDPERRVVVSTKVGRRLEPRPDADLTRVRQGFVSPEPYESVFDYSYDAVMRSYEGSRARLRRDIDVLYVHDLGRRAHGERHPHLFAEFMDGGYKALRQLRDGGAVQAIGLGVNEWEVCEDALAHGDFDIMLLAGRYTLLEQTALTSFLPLCQQRKVGIVVGGPYNSGILAHDGRYGMRRQAPLMYEYQPAPPEIVARVAALEAVCQRHGVPLASAALQFPLAHPQVLSVIPGMGNPDEVRGAKEWLTLPIPATFWAELRAQGLVHPDAPLPETA